MTAADILSMLDCPPNFHPPWFRDIRTLPVHKLTLAKVVRRL